MNGGIRSFLGDRDGGLTGSNKDRLTSTLAYQQLLAALT